jgi:voltage-gated potassium channel
MNTLSPTKREIWELTILFFVTYSCLEIPLSIAFNFGGHGLLLISLITSIFFLADLVFSINTHLKNFDFWKYFKFWFWIDFVSAIPFEIIYFSDIFDSNQNFLNVLSIIRLLRILKIFQVIHKFIKRSHIVQGKNTILIFAYFISIGTHWIALIWIKLRGAQLLEEPDSITIYNKALYWTVTTLTTIGYGDIVPVTNPQRIFTMIVMIIGAGLYGYIIGNITNLLSNLDYARTLFQEKMEKIHTFLKYRKVPMELQETVFDYYKFLWENRKGYDESSIMEELPSSLRMKIALHLNKAIFEKIPLFKEASEDLIKEIVLHLKPLIYTPGDHIFEKGDMAIGMYFISRGSVEVINKQTSEIYATISEGGYFGEIALLLSTPRTATIRAIDYCDLYLLDRDIFLKVIERYPTFAHKVKEMATEREKSNKKRESHSKKTKKKKA